MLRAARTGAACLLAATLMVAAPAARAADLSQLMTDARVPGVSMALIRNGKMPVPVQAGVRNVTTAEPVDADTVFASASLS
jgi:CubicO group peptidase (beta-lactamase class C family)